jgi:glycosyltransferase involved in cell wall biosynthesis
LGITASQRGEDVVISWDYRNILESKYGIKFAPLEIAHQFSVDLNLNLKYGPSENLPWLGKSFGFHGLHCAKQYYGSEVGDVLPVIKKKESKMKIAVYTVALNEQQFAARWANSVQQADYLIVADTGSTDGTQQALKDQGVQVFDISVRPWRFDMARNIALSLVPADADVCISMDMDELMAPGWREGIEKHWIPNATKLRYTYVHNFDHNDQPVHSFVADKIHSRFGYQWRRPVHENIFALGDELAVTVPSVVMWHKQDAAKSRGQYLPLLEQSHKEFPECSQTAYWLAREYAFVGNNDTAIEHFKKYLNMPEAAWSDERAEAATWLSKLCSHEKLKWLLMAVGESPQRREGWLNLAEHYYTQADWSNLYASALEGTKITHRSNSYLDYPHAWGGRIWDLAGLGAWNLGLKHESLRLFEQAHKLEPTDARIHNNYILVKQHIDALTIKEHT